MQIESLLIEQNGHFALNQLRSCLDSSLFQTVKIQISNPRRPFNWHQIVRNCNTSKKQVRHRRLIYLAGAQRQRISMWGDPSSLTAHICISPCYTKTRAVRVSNRGEHFTTRYSATTGVKKSLSTQWRR